MPRIEPATYERVEPAAQAIWDEQTRQHGRMTNMKRTLAHDPLALEALMTWYPLHDAVANTLGERSATLFAHAISTQAECLICSTFFRRLLIDAGEDPDQLQVTEQEQTLIDFGRQLADDPHGVDDALYARLATFLTPREIVTLTAFGALMVATNLFNDALQVDLDEYLFAYRKPVRDDADETQAAQEPELEAHRA